jgi:hypothetical protein
MAQFFSGSANAKFDIKFDVKGEGIFKEGHTFAPMTYKALCEHVAYESCRLGGPPLRPQRRLDADSGLIDYVSFYCPHGRKHDDQAGRAPVKNPGSSRASRVNEDRRIMFCDCDFQFRVVRDPKVPPILVVEDKDKAHSVDAEASSSVPDDGLGLSKTKHDSTIFGWYVDCKQRQMQEGRYKRDYHCFIHKHLRRSQPIADVDERMRQVIKDLAQHNIAIGSISSKIYSQFGVYLSDEQLRFELLKMEIHVSAGRIDIQTSGNMSSSQKFVNSMLLEKNLSVAFLFENLTTSSESCIVYDTYVNDNLVAAGDQSVGVDVSKPKSSDIGGHDDVVEHGRVYDKNRIVSMPRCSDKLFFVGTCWVNHDELRVFQHYPEILVVDSKANTNKYKKAFFSGVGVDGFWKNCTLFRSWIPNQTEAAYAWLITRAVPLLVPSSIRKKVEVIMSDADAAMGAVIDGCCGDGQKFPKAIHCFCVYHFERNFFQEFGVGSKHYGLKKSCTSRRKGGNTEWGHAWQKELVSAIYRCQKCESEAEFDQCKMWIRQYIDLHPDLTLLLKRKLQAFFARKFELHMHWLHMHRLGLRHLSIISSSRIEGEFGAIWFLRLHANTTLRHAFEKLAWASRRRRRKRLSEVEDAFSKWVKRQSDVIIDEDDWQFLVTNMTKYYRARIEKVMGQVKKYKSQLVQATVSELEFNVWRVVYDDDDSDCEVDDDDSDASGDVSDDDGSVDMSEAGPECLSVNAQSDGTAAPGNPQPKQFSDIQPFLWRRVRRVKLVYSIEKKRYFVFCSCKRCEGTCVPCVHLVNTMELFGTVRLRDLDWHPRVSNGYYYSALVSDEDAVFDPMERFHPHILEASVQEWREVNEKYASRVGVPEEGLLDANFDHVAEDGGDFGDGESGDDAAAAPTKSKRAPAYNAAFAQRMHYAIEGALPASSPFWREYCEFQNQFFATISRRSVTFSGVGATNRKRSIADVAQGRGGSGNVKMHKQGSRSAEGIVMAAAAQPHGGIKESTKAPFGWNINFQGKTEGNARDFLERFGAHEKWIVELYPNAEHPGFVVGDRWFMKIVNGLVQGPPHNPYITACRWMIKNSVTRMDAVAYPDNLPCEIRRVTAYGPPECHLFSDVKA